MRAGLLASGGACAGQKRVRVVCGQGRDGAETGASGSCRTLWICTHAGGERCRATQQVGKEGNVQPSGVCGTMQCVVQRGCMDGGGRGFSLVDAFLVQRWDLTVVGLGLACWLGLRCPPDSRARWRARLWESACAPRLPSLGVAARAQLSTSKETFQPSTVNPGLIFASSWQWGLQTPAEGCAECRCICHQETQLLFSALQHQACQGLV